MATQPQLAETFEPPIEGDNDDPQPRDFEAEARQHGWTPKDDFKGDESRWIDAETFVKRADEVMPLLKKKTAAQDREIADLKKTVRTLTDHMSKTEERMFNRALAELEERQEKAVEEGDIDAHRKIGKEIKDLEKEVTNKAPDSGIPDEAAQAETALEAKYPWYAKPGDERDFAIFLANGKYSPLAQTMPPAEFFEFVAQKTIEHFPNLKAGTERRKPLNPVEPPSAPASRRGEKSFENLPADAKAACDRLFNKGILKGAGGKTLSQAEARAQYCRDYDWS